METMDKFKAKVEQKDAATKNKKATHTATISRDVRETVGDITSKNPKIHSFPGCHIHCSFNLFYNAWLP